MSNCQTIADMLPEYINNRTTRNQNSEIACHISSCLSCRADFALWLSVEHTLRQSVKNTPSIDFRTMFDKLPNKETELEKIIKTGSSSMAFDIIRYTFSIVKTTYKLAGLF